MDVGARDDLTAAIDQEAGTYVDALQERRILPDDGAASTPRSVIVALLALISGEEPAAAEVMSFVNQIVRVSRPAVPGRPDPHSDRPFSVAGAAGCLGGLTRTPIDHDPCLSSDLSTAREHLATRFHLANARDPRRA